MHFDDPAIQDQDLLYRRIASSGDANMLLFDEKTQERRVRGGAFVMDDDGCSTYLDSVLRNVGLSAADVAVVPQNVVISVTVAQVREVLLGVRPDPWPPYGTGHPRDAAHSLIVNPNGLGSSRRSRSFRALAGYAVFCVWP